MTKYADFLVRNARGMRGHMDKLAGGVHAEQFARKPTWGIGGGEINANHGAWIYGHLAIYPARMADLLGMKIAGVETPAHWHDLFKNGSLCRDDPHDSIYPAMSQLVTTCAKAHDAIIAKVAELPDADLFKPNPIEAYKERMPLVGDALSALLGNHIMYHLGQMSTWRRCMGLPGT